MIKSKSNPQRVKKKKKISLTLPLPSPSRAPNRPTLLHTDRLPIPGHPRKHRRASSQLLLTSVISPTLHTFNPTVINGTFDAVYTFPNATSLTGIVEYRPGHDGQHGPQLNLRVERRFQRAYPPHTPNANGLTALPTASDVLLLSDSTSGAVWQLDARTGASRVAIQDPSMLPSAAPVAGINAGISGLHVRFGAQTPYLHFANSHLATFSRVALNFKHGNVSAEGPIETLATIPPAEQQQQPDDFALDERGRAWVTVHPGAVTVFSPPANRVAGNWSQFTVLGDVNGTDVQLFQPTSAAFGHGSSAQTKTLNVSLAPDTHLPYARSHLGLNLRLGFRSFHVPYGDGSYYTDWVREGIVVGVQLNWLFHLKKETGRQGRYKRERNDQYLNDGVGPLRYPPWRWNMRTENGVRKVAGERRYQACDIIPSQREQTGHAKLMVHIPPHHRCTYTLLHFLPPDALTEEFFWYLQFHRPEFGKCPRIYVRPEYAEPRRTVVAAGDEVDVQVKPESNEHHRVGSKAAGMPSLPTLGPPVSSPPGIEERRWWGEQIRAVVLQLVNCGEVKWTHSVKKPLPSVEYVFYVQPIQLYAPGDGSWFSVVSHCAETQGEGIER
ncbi:hypothetical protein B0H16DRAFT_1704417 [Mycena metata]|uniref:Uncharacterized protein n=1 Tax=Mycena metata TaxID=1033252 RepID=A0AAD7GW49_9AGAR|nr:hypothetical protein B0H16DRAFT_1704417 [Mycena metata]